jgi:TrmH family RNA methyltransferase
MLNLKNLAKLQQKKYRQEYCLFLVEGRKGIEEALASGQMLEQLVMTRQFAELHGEAFLNQTSLIVTDTEFHQLTETVNPEGVIAALKLPKTELSMLMKTKDAQQIAILEDIRDPGNLGTMIRTADWFGLDGLLLLGGADPYQPKVVRASMGSIFHLPIVHSQNPSTDLAQLKKSGFTLIATRPELANIKQTPVTSMPTQAKIALIFGNEAHGTSTTTDQLADRSISIPRYGRAESLNVAVSFGILLSQLKK